MTPNPYNLAVDPDRPLGFDAAREGLPALRAEAIQLADTLAMLSAKLRLHQTKLDAALAVLAPDNSIPIPMPRTEIHVGLTGDEFESAVSIVTALQKKDPDLSVDVCMAEIFTAGLTTLSHRLFPA